MVIKLPTGIKEMVLNPQKVIDLYKRFDAIPGLFDDFSRGDFQLFESRLNARDSLWFETEDEQGVLYATNLMPGVSAQGHFVFFDRRLRGRESLVMDLLRYIMAGADLKKMNVYLPSYAGSARHFVERLGFRHEGCLRRWSYSKSRLYDMHLYGITFEEAFDGSTDANSDREPREGMGLPGPELVQQSGSAPSDSTGQSSDAREHESNPEHDRPSVPGDGTILRGDDEGRGDESDPRLVPGHI